MSISEIQKRKFLNNIYKLLYTTGISETDTAVRQPDENEVKREFDKYFSLNRIGNPLSVDINLLRNVSTLDPELMNLMMARSLLNLEVLYDSLDENSEKMMDVITVLDRKLKFLKEKRIQLEKRIDDVLFSLSNSDGYFYSFSDVFSNIQNVDLSLTNAFVDTENRKVTLPKLKSAVFEFNSPGKITYSNVKYTIYFNGNPVVENATLPDAVNMFDGLNNTKSTVEYGANTAGSCALVLTVPFNTPFVVSKVDGKISTSSAVVTVAELTSQSSATESQFRRKQSNSDYDRFSFDFNPQSSGLLKLTFIKYEPDYIDNNSASNKYKYNFSIRDLIVSGQYYDKNATMVSSPISIPVGDVNKVIDAVSLQATNSNEGVGSINFFIAQDVPGASNISDFNWIPISPGNSSNNGFDEVISFNKSSKSFKNIKLNPGLNDITLYPKSTSSNLSIKNPTSSIYSRSKCI